MDITKPNYPRSEGDSGSGQGDSFVLNQVSSSNLDYLGSFKFELSNFERSDIIISTHVAA